MADYVLDSSAVLAELYGEPGGDLVGDVARTSCMSAVNHAEVITSLIELGIPEGEAQFVAARVDCQIIEADQDRAALAGRLHATTRRTGVSLADRFCLALGRELRLPVLTTDRRWADLDLGVEVRLLR